MNASLSWVHAEALRSVSRALDPTGAAETLHERQQLLGPLAFIDPGGRADPPRLAQAQRRWAEAVRPRVLEGLEARGVVVVGDRSGLTTSERQTTEPAAPTAAEVIEALRRMRRSLPAGVLAAPAIDAAIGTLGPSVRVRAEMLSERLAATTRARVRSLRQRIAGRG